MIVYKLNCKDCNFNFEGWFDNSKDFDKQKRNNFINCPSCNSIKINKSLMSPNLNKKSNSKKIENSKKTVVNKIEKFIF